MDDFDFAKLDKLDSSLKSYAKECRALIDTFPNSSIGAASAFCERMTLVLFEKHGMECPQNQVDRLRVLKQNKLLPGGVLKSFHKVRLARNPVSHAEEMSTSEKARSCWEEICNIGDWAYKKYCREKKLIPKRHKEESAGEPLNTIQMLILSISFLLSIAAGILTYLITDEAVLSLFIPLLFYPAYVLRSEFSRTSVLSAGLFFFCAFLIYAMLIVIAFCLWDWKLSLLILVGVPLYLLSSMGFWAFLDDFLCYPKRFTASFERSPISWAVFGQVILWAITAGAFWLFGYACAFLIVALVFLFVFFVGSKDEKKKVRYLVFPCCAGVVLAPFLYYFFDWWAVIGWGNVLLAGMALLVFYYDNLLIKTAIILGLTDLLLVAAELFYLCGFSLLAVILALVACAIGPVCIIHNREKN